jgi:hypothetical protein
MAAGAKRANLAREPRWRGIPLQIVAGIVVADVGTSFFHWMEDTYLWYGHPVFTQVSIDNEMHHYRPRTITYWNTWQTVENSVYFVVLAVGIFALKLPPARYAPFLLTACLTGSTVNLLHKFLHQRDCERPGFVTALQRSGVLVSRATHKRHHSDDVSHRDYGVILAPLNSLYDAIGLWDRLEFGASCLGLPPCKKRGANAYGDADESDNFDVECPRPLTGEDVAKYYERLRQMFDADRGVPYSKCAPH